MSRSRAPEARVGRNPAFSWRFTAPLFIGSALNPINSSLIATALVPIAAGVNVSIGKTATLVSVLYLASTIAQPTAGKAAEVFGPRRVFVTGILLVLAGGLVGGFVSSLGPLLLARVLIGFGTSCANPTAMVLVRRRARIAGLTKPPGGVLGGLQVAGVATASLGLPVGGVLVELFGWRAVFFVNVPVALIALAATLLWIPRDDPGQRSGDSIVSALDVPGIVGFAAAMTTLLLFLSALPDPQWPILAASIALWGALVAWELRARTPFLDIRLLAHNRDLTRTYLRFAGVMLCSYIVLYGISQWVQDTKGLSALLTGMLLLPMTLISGIVTVPLSRRNLVRAPLILTAIACGVAGTAVLLLPGPTWIAVTLVITVLLGFAQGAGGASNTIALYTQAPEDQLGTASGLLRSFGYFGSIASSAVIGIVFRDHTDAAGVSVIGIVMIGAALALLALTVFDRRRLPRIASA